jgi:excisionase family DNA binding protein
MTRAVREPMLTAAAIAAELSISDEKARQMLRQGEIPARKCGRIWRARREDVDSYIAGNMPDDEIAEILRNSPPLTDQQIDDVVAIIRTYGGA